MKNSNMILEIFKMYIDILASNKQNFIVESCLNDSKVEGVYIEFIACPNFPFVSGEIYPGPNGWTHKYIRETLISMISKSIDDGMAAVCNWCSIPQE